MLLERAKVAADVWDRILAVAERLDDADWSRSTPCEEWDVADLIAHLPAIQHLFDGGPNPEPPAGWAPAEGTAPRSAWTAVGVVARRGWTPEQLLDDVRRARDGHVERLQRVSDWDAKTFGPVGETTEAGLFEVRMMDVWIHLQDLHLALDEPIDAPDLSGAAEAAHHYFLKAFPYLFAKKMDTSDGSSLRMTLGAPVDVDSVLVMVDGRAKWDEHADPGDCSVRADPAAMTLLVTGRRSPEHWREAGLLEWTGDLGEQFVRRARFDI